MQTIFVLPSAAAVDLDKFELQPDTTVLVVPTTMRDGIATRHSLAGESGLLRIGGTTLCILWGDLDEAALVAHAEALPRLHVIALSDRALAIALAAGVASARRAEVGTVVWLLGTEPASAEPA